MVLIFQIEKSLNALSFNLVHIVSVDEKKDLYGNQSNNAKQIPVLFTRFLNICPNMIFSKNIMNNSCVILEDLS